MNVVHYSLKVDRVLENNDNKKPKQNCEKQSVRGKILAVWLVHSLSIIHSFHLLYNSSSIAFTSRYLCFGPEGPDIVSIPTSQNKHKPDTIISFVSIPQHLNQLPFMAVSHYCCLVLQEEDDYLSSASSPRYLLASRPPYLSLSPVVSSSSIPPSFSCGSCSLHVWLCLLWCSLHSSQSFCFSLFFLSYVLYYFYPFNLLCLWLFNVIFPQSLLLNPFFNSIFSWFFFVVVGVFFNCLETALLQAKAHSYPLTYKQHLRYANLSKETHSLPNTHHTIKHKSWSNSCYESLCMCICQLIVS